MRSRASTRPSACRRRAARRGRRCGWRPTACVPGTSSRVTRYNGWRAAVGDADEAPRRETDSMLLARVERAERRREPRGRRRSDREPEPPPAPVPVDVQSLPSWLRAAVFLGVPSVIALFLVWALTTQVAARVTAIEAAQQLQAQTLAAIVDSVNKQAAAAADTREHFDGGVARIERLVRATCVVAARSAEERSNCLNRD